MACGSSPGGPGLHGLGLLCALGVVARLELMLAGREPRLLGAARQLARGARCDRQAVIWLCTGGRRGAGAIESAPGVATAVECRREQRGSSTCDRAEFSSVCDVDLLGQGAALAVDGCR